MEKKSYKDLYRKSLWVIKYFEKRISDELHSEDEWDELLTNADLLKIKEEYENEK